MKKTRRCLFFILLLLFLSSCQNQDNSKDNSKSTDEINQEVEEDKKAPKEDMETIEDIDDKQVLESELIPLPQNIEDVLEYPRGKFVGLDKENPAILEELQKVPVFPNNASEEELEQLFHYLYSLFKDDYIDSRNVIESFQLGVTPNQENIENIKDIEQFNVEIILDASGSMAGKVGSKTKMTLAKESIQKYASTLSEHANVALRVYGHKGSNDNKDQVLSCSSSELIYPLQRYNQDRLNQALHSFQPTGWTPLAYSMQEAIKDFEKVDLAKSRNIIYIVRDGVETCDGDPIKAAKELKQSGLSPVVNIIGFDVDQEGQEQLKKVAEAAGGHYTTVQNQEELNQEFKRSIEEYGEWVSWLVNSNTDLNTYYLKHRQRLQSDLLDWKSTARNEGHMIQYVAQNLWFDKKITSEQSSKIIDRRYDYYNSQNKHVEQLFNELNKDLQAIYDSNNQKIDEIFEKNK